MKPIEPEMASVPAGEAVLGAPACPAAWSLPHRWVGPRRVEVGAFRIARQAVTRREYEAFLTDTGHPPPADWDDPVLGQALQPACGVTAADADRYCQWLAAKTGRPYRLPHADEWEKAARGGREGAIFPWGDEDPAGRCWYGRSEKEGPRPVGSFPPNGFGLYDMVGNIWQWLADLYIEVARDKPVNIPTGKPAELNRVLVGGSFMTGNAHCLWVAYRHEDPPDLRHRCLGFRLALD